MLVLSCLPQCDNGGNALLHERQLLNGKLPCLRNEKGRVGV